jgi:hypothetical protein
MTITIEYWCDSGANIDSCYRDKTTTDELGFTDQEWRDLSEDEKEKEMRELAWERLDWGWEEIKSD